MVDASVCCHQLMITQLIVNDHHLTSLLVVTSFLPEEGALNYVFVLLTTNLVVDPWTWDVRVDGGHY
ncbi:hypothetical protein D3C80_1329520 [compost metagenome]